jgi:hypothetical protein
MIKRQLHYLTQNEALICDNNIYFLNAVGSYASGSGGFGSDMVSGGFDTADTSASYYFDDYLSGENWVIGAANMVDGDPDTYAEASIDDTQLCNSNTATDLGSDIYTVKMRTKGFAGHPPQSWYLRPVFSGTTSGAIYDLKSRMPLSNQSVEVSGTDSGTRYWTILGVKPGKPHRANGGQGVYNSGAYFHAYDAEGNLWLQCRTSGWANKVNTQEKNIQSGMVYKNFGQSSWIDKIYEPSGAINTWIDFNWNKGKPAGTNDDNWYFGDIFYNELTGRMGHVAFESGTSNIKIAEFSETGVDYPNQYTYEKILDVTGGPSSTLRGCAHDPVNDNYIISDGTNMYVIDGTLGTVLRQRAVRRPSGTYNGNWGLTVSGGVLFQQADYATSTPWIYACDPLTLTASTTVQPSAVNYTFRGNGYAYGGLAHNPVTKNFSVGASTGSLFYAIRKWSSDNVVSRTFSDYSEWIDITNDPNAPETWTWNDVINLDVKNFYEESDDSGNDGVQSSIIELQVGHLSKTQTLTATTSGYFDIVDGYSGWTNFNNAVDGDPSTVATGLGSNSLTIRNDTWFTGITSDITKVEMRARVANEPGNSTYFRIRMTYPGGQGDIYDINDYSSSLAWTPWYDVTDDTNAPGTGNWTWTDVQDTKMQFQGSLSGPGGEYVGQGEIKVTYDENAYVGPTPPFNNPSWDGYISEQYFDNNYWTGENSTIVGPSGTKTWSWATTGWAFTGSNATSATFQPGQSSDDGYVTEGSSSFNNVGNSLYSDVAREAFVRFPNVNIPPGARIKAATLTVHANNTNSGDVYSRLYFNKETDAVAPTSFAEWQALSFSTNYIEYFSDAFVDNYDYTFFDKDTGADLSVALQEIIDQPGWSSGNAIMILSDESPTETSTGTRLWDSWDQNSGVGSPMLRVTWDDNGATQSTFSTSGWQPLTTVGTWAQGYRPARARISYSGPGDNWDRIRIKDTLGNVLTSGSNFRSGENLKFNHWYNNADMQTLEVSSNSGPWDITNIEFITSGSYVSTITGDIHDFNQRYDDPPSVIIPAKAIQVTPNDLKLVFAEAIDGRAFIRDDDYFHQQTVASTTWDIQHNLNSFGQIVQCYDHNREWVFPEEITLDGRNRTICTFAQPVSGEAVFITFASDINLDNTTALFGDPNLGTKGYWKIGDGGDNPYFDPKLNNDINSILTSGSGLTQTETTTAASGTILINFEVPENGAYTINEFGVYDRNQDLHYYSRCSTLYKPDGVALHVRYRIRKE